MGYSPTIVAASLSDKELKDSIDKLVKYVDTGAQKMAESMNTAVEKMKKSLQSLGDVSISSSGASDGGASRRAKSQNEENKEIERNITVRKEQKATLDQMATATTRFAVRQDNTLFSTMSTDIGILKERLNSAHSQFSSFVVLAKHAQQVGDKGMYQFATENLHSYEEQVKRIITALRGMSEAQRQMRDVVQPQGHSIQNFVKDLLNTTSVGNTALREMGDYYRRMEQESKGAAVSTRNYSDEIKTLAAAIRSTTDYTAGKHITVPTPYGTDIAVNIKDKVSIEEKLLDAYNKQMMAKSQLDAIEQTENTQVSARLGLEKEINSELEKRKRVYKTPETKIDESFRQLVAKSIGVDQKEVIGYTTRIDRLSASLKQLQSAYNHLTASERNTPFGRQLREEIQQTSRDIDKAKKEMMRPVDLRSIIKLPTNTLDEINYKIRQLQSYSQGIRFNTETGKRELKELQTEIDNLRRKQVELIGMNNNLLKSNTALGRSWNYMKNRLAFYFTVGASTQFVKNLIEVRSQYEMNERALGILINSAERGTQIFQELSNMALVSPYTLIELSTAAKQLTAYDVAARDVVDTTRRLADMASAVGIPIDRLTYALGQIKAYGYLNSRDARMFANAGIPLVKSLADHYTELEGKLVSTADIYDRIKKKAIGYNDVMQVVAEMTDEGGKFFDFQAKMAGTLKVQLANLTLAWNNMLNDIGKSEQGLLSTGIGLFKSMFANWKQLNRVLEDCLYIFGALKLAQLAYYGVVHGTNKAIALETVLGKRLKTALIGLGQTMNTVLTSGATWWGVLITAIGGAILSIWRGNEAMKEFNRSLREDAENTYKDITKFLEQYSEIQERLTNEQKSGGTEGGIDSDTAKKTWVAVKEQIELSSKASDEYISKLLTISDTSDRLRAGFSILDDIRSVTAAIEELNDGGIKLERQWSEWWNLWTLPDGTVGNLKDTYTWLDKIEEEFGSIRNASKAALGIFQGNEFEKAIDKGVQQSKAIEYLENYGIELKKFRDNLSVTTESIVNFIDRMEWSGNAEKIQETFSRALEKFGHQNNLSNKQMMTVRLEAADAEKDALVKALSEQREIELNTYKNTLDEKERMEAKRRADELKVERDFLIQNTAQSRVYWDDFTKWMGRQHKSEVQKMFRGMNEEQIRTLDLGRINYSKWITELAQKYAKEHGWSYEQVYNQLKNYIFNANQWSIRIPLIISSEEGKSVYETLTEADTAIDTAYKKIQRLRTRQKELDLKGGALSDDKNVADESVRVTKEIADAQNDYNRAIEQGGHSKKEDAAANKARKQAESELQKALKEELSILDKTRSVYKSLTKEGVSSTEALDVATQGYGKTLKWINSVLAKHGIAPIDITKYAGVQNPAAVMQMLQSQLQKLASSPSVKPEEIKDLEVKLKDLKVDSITFDHKTITDSLNNELSKLKDEYELSVELDANPEIGDAFLDMFDIDPDGLVHGIDGYMDKVRGEFDKLRDNYANAYNFDIFTADAKTWEEWGKVIGVTGDALEGLKKPFVDAQGVVKKWAQDTISNTRKLEYEFAELDEKIAVKEREQQNLRERIAEETNEMQKHYLELQLQNNQKAIDELKAQALSLLPEYAKVFNSISEYSTSMARKLQNKLMKVYEDATYDSASKIWTLTGEDGTKVQLTDKEYRKEREKLTKEMRKTQKPFSKISEAFRKGEDGVIDYVKGIELVGQEIQKVGSIVTEVGNLANILGANKNDIENINDLAATINGVATAADGITKLASGDYLGGAASILSGVVSVIGYWADNDNKKIDRQLKDSEEAVKRLETAYKNLSYAIDKAYGMATIGANKAALANKQLQLAELKRQLSLEQSRESKDRDNDKIESLRGSIIDLEHEIKDGVENIVADLLGVSSVSDAASKFMDSYVEAMRSGTDANKTFSESVNDMIANMVKKMLTTKIIQPWFEQQWKTIQDEIDARGADSAKAYEEAMRKFDRAKAVDMANNDSLVNALRDMGMSDNVINSLIWYDENGNQDPKQSGATKRLQEAYRKLYEKLQKETEEKAAQLAKDTEYTTDDIKRYAELLRSGQPILDDNMKSIEQLLKELGLYNDKVDEKQLSALQQGIQGITEDTAGALEAYMNGVSQQVYLQSEYLRQIAEVLVTDADPLDDVKVASLSQILLQLRSSYEVQMSIQTMLEDIHDSGNRAFRVITI